MTKSAPLDGRLRQEMEMDEMTLPGDSIHQTTARL